MFLSRYFAGGVEVLLPLTHAARAALMYRDPLQRVRSEQDAWSSAHRALDRNAKRDLT